MGEQIGNAAAKLVPLLLLLLAVFGVLILLALLLRARVRAETRRARPRRKPGSFQSGDMVMVLGRSFTVERVEPLSAKLTCLVLGGEERARLLFEPGAEQAVYFPGRLAELPGAGELPERLETGGAAYRRQGEGWQAASGRLACYRAESGAALLVEAGERLELWRGKDIPAEGVQLIDDAGAGSPPAAARPAAGAGND